MNKISYIKFYKLKIGIAEKMFNVFYSSRKKIIYADNRNIFWERTMNRPFQNREAGKEGYSDW